MIRTCSQSNPCPEDQPLDNFSSEGDDTLDFISTFYSGGPAPLLRDWTATECDVTFVSHISQADADLQARAAAELCNLTHTNPGIETFLNTPQVCCVPCPDGTQTCYAVPGGLFSAASQQAANSLAYQVACNMASAFKVCLSNLARCTCINTQYASTITAVGVGPFEWSIVGGSLPPGLSFLASGNTAEIIGTTLASGTYVFQVQATSPAGTYMIKTYSIVVLSIDVSNLPPYTIGVPYSYQIPVSGGSGNYNFKITSGSLPNGLTLSLTGLISGVPQ